MAENKMQLEDWLDDLCVRFIIHLPKEDLSSVARICFQVEEAQWFYEDFIRPLDPTLPSMSLRSFCLRIFQHCPLLAPFSAENHMRAFEEFMQYKTRVPVRGAILLNEAMDSTVLVKGWKKGANWSFPRGKINKDEDDLDCAVREVYEETGFDIKQAGLVPREDEVKYIQISMREQQIRLYVFRNVPMDTVFEPKTRKEISKVEWYKLSELPAFRKKGNNSHDDAAAASNANKFYMVAPFLVPLKKWVVQQKKKDGTRVAAANLAIHHQTEEPLTEDDIGAQLEPVPAPSNGAPAIETMEGATRELQRLLNVQQPTQGLQMSPSASSAGKGGALMALLQKSAEMAPQQSPQQALQPQSHIPHAPSDLTYTNAPDPDVSHHHQKQPALNYQQPPNFPTPPTSVQNAASGYYGQGREAMPQIYGRNPFVNPAQQQRNEPVLLHPQPLPPQVQQSVLTRGILPTPALMEAVNQGRQHAQQDGQHVHYGGPHTQPAAQNTQQGGPHSQLGSQHVQQGALDSFTARPNDTYASQQQAAKPAQLTGHAMSLLSAFKTNSPRENMENKSRENTPQDNAFVPANNQHQYHGAPWANAPTTQAPNPAAQFLPQHMAPVGPMRTSPRGMQPSESQAGSKPSQPADTHRTALLDMFKKGGPRSPLSNEIRMQPGNTQQSPGFSRNDEPASPSYNAPSAAEAIAQASEANGAPVRMNPEVNLPYRAVQILSRPKQGEQNKSQEYTSAMAQMQRLQQRFSPHDSRQDARNAGRQGIPSPRDRGFLQQTEHEAKRSPQPSYAAAHAASLPYAQQSPSSPRSNLSFQQQQQQQPTAVDQRRNDSNPEQKQKLLSLFSKEQQQQQQQHRQQRDSPASITAEEKGKGKDPSGMYDSSRTGTGSTPRSRVASFASGGGNEPAIGGSAATSRRGSGTPISPADRSFLLSYLESVTGVGR
jgi:mRNA-decapping enzyme subunit 2